MISDWYHVDDKAENRYYAEPVNYKLRRNKCQKQERQKATCATLQDGQLDSRKKSCPNKSIA